MRKRAADGPSQEQLQLVLDGFSPTLTGPRGVRVGDVVVAEGSRWRVEAVYPARREAGCRLLNGSRCLRRFRARQILRVERSA